MDRDRIERLLAVIGVVGCALLALALHRAGKDAYYTLSTVGSVASLVGLGIVLLQLQSIKRVSEATSRAVSDTRAQLILNVSIADVSRLIKLIEQVQSSAGDGKFELAHSKLQDARILLIQLSSHPVFPRAVAADKLSAMLSTIGITLTSLYGAAYSADKRIDSTRMHRALEIVIEAMVKFENHLKFEGN